MGWDYLTGGVGLQIRCKGRCKEMDFSARTPSGQLKTLDDPKHWDSAGFSGLASPVYM